MTFAHATRVAGQLVTRGYAISLAGRDHPEHGEHFTVEVVALTMEHEQLVDLLALTDREGLTVRIDSGRVRLIANG